MVTLKEEKLRWKLRSDTTEGSIGLGVRAGGQVDGDEKLKNAAVEDGRTLVSDNGLSWHLRVRGLSAVALDPAHPPLTASSAAQRDTRKLRGNAEGTDKLADPFQPREPADGNRPAQRSPALSDPESPAMKDGESGSLIPRCPSPARFGGKTIDSFAKVRG